MYTDVLDVLRPVLTASRPSQTIAQMGPLSMSMEGISGFRRAKCPRHTSNEAFVEGLICEILVVLLEVLFRRGYKLHSRELVTFHRISVMFYKADGGNACPRFSNREMISPMSPRCDC